MSDKVIIEESAKRILKEEIYKGVGYLKNTNETSVGSFAKMQVSGADTIVPENIKKDETILGIVGSYSCDDKSLTLTDANLMSSGTTFTILTKQNVTVAQYDVIKQQLTIPNSVDVPLSDLPDEFKIKVDSSVENNRGKVFGTYSSIDLNNISCDISIDMSVLPITQKVIYTPTYPGLPDSSVIWSKDAIGDGFEIRLTL